MVDSLLADSLIALPVLAWAGLAMMVLCVQIISPNIRLSVLVSLIGLFGMIAYCGFSFNPGLEESVFSGTLAFDSFTQFFNLLALLIVTGVVLSVTPVVFEKSGVVGESSGQLPEFFVCLLMAGFGTAVTVSAYDLTVFFLGIETLAISLYCLCGFYRKDVRSTESALKYLLVGGVFDCYLAIWNHFYFWRFWLNKLRCDFTSHCSWGSTLCFIGKPIYRSGSCF